MLPLDRDGARPCVWWGDLAEATLEGAFRDLPSCVAEILKVTGVVFNATLAFEEKLKGIPYRSEIGLAILDRAPAASGELATGMLCG